MRDQCKYAVGDVVYRNYRVGTVGRVTAVREGKWAPWDQRPNNLIDAWLCTVEQPNGKTYEANDLTLEDFRALIAEHRRKLDRHEALLQRIEAQAALRALGRDLIAGAKADIAKERRSGRYV